jgi:hypothetical protein
VKHTIATALLLATMLAPPLAAQRTSPVPPLLLLPGSTRAMGMGNAYVAGSGPDVVFYNPAQVGESRGTVLSWQAFAGHASLASLATNTTLLGASIGAGVQYVEYRAQRADGSTPTGELTRAGAEVATSTLGLLSASVERHGIRIGLTAKYLAQHLAGERRSVPTFDFGVAGDVGAFTLAMVLQDAEDVIEDGAAAGIHLPTRMALGAMMSSVPISTWLDLGVTAMVSTDETNTITPAGGIEVSYLPVSGWSFTGRIGAQRITMPARAGESSLTFGASIGADRLAIDYAFQQYRGPGATHRVGIRIR